MEPTTHQNRGVNRFRVGTAMVNIVPDEAAMGTAAQERVRDLAFSAADAGKRIVFWLMAAPSGFAWYDAFVWDANHDPRFGALVEEAEFFQFDDYPIARGDSRFPVTFRHLLEDRVFARLERPGTIRLLELAGSEDDARIMSEYAAVIETRVDDPDCFVIQVKGIGMDGHWGFHGRETPLDYPATVMSVAINRQNRIQQTIDWPQYFPTVEDVPDYAATASVALFRRAHAIVDLVPQASKAFAVLMSYGSDRVIEAIPSSVLTEVPLAEAYLTAAAAGALAAWRAEQRLSDDVLAGLDALWGDDLESRSWARAMLAEGGFI